MDDDAHIFPDSNCAPVSVAAGLVPARMLARSMFRRLGTRQPARAEILVMVNELATNIIRHGGEGEICIYPVRLGSHTGFFICARDRGPGIEDLEKALEPGRSEDGGLGLGLNTVRNLSDDLRVSSLINGGAMVEVWKWLS